MRVILGGKFENALIREIDAVNWPDRNRTTHPYYLGLNRKPDRLFFERAATFLTIAEQTIVPVADWSGARDDEALSGRSLGLLTQQGEYNEWDRNARKYAEFLLDKRVLTPGGCRYISDLDLSDLSLADQQHIRQERKIGRDVAVHYLCRLFLQVREAGEHKTFLVLDEIDVQLLAEVSRFIKNGGLRPNFPLPDLDAKVILGQTFAGGLFNFAPKDAASVAAIRADPTIQSYAKRVRAVIGQQATIERERELVQAMRQSADGVRRAAQIDSVFEVASWVAKPLHYVPGVDAVLSIAEDTADVVGKVLGTVAENNEWYLLAARAQRINTEEYLLRKQNL